MPRPGTLALTIKQPWADAIVHGTKRVENRRWTTTYRGPLLIHAGLGYDPAARFLIDPAALTAWPDVRGALIATATLTGIHPAQGCCMPWGESGSGVFHWQLTDVTALPTPVPCKGRLRLWTPDITLTHL